MLILNNLPGGCKEWSTWAFIWMLRTNSIILRVLDIHKQGKAQQCENASHNIWIMIGDNRFCIDITVFATNFLIVVLMSPFQCHSSCSFTCTAMSFGAFNTPREKVSITGQSTTNNFCSCGNLKSCLPLQKLLSLGKLLNRKYSNFIKGSSEGSFSLSLATISSIFSQSSMHNFLSFCKLAAVDDFTIISNPAQSLTCKCSKFSNSTEDGTIFLSLEHLYTTRVSMFWIIGCTSDFTSHINSRLCKLLSTKLLNFILVL